MLEMEAIIFVKWRTSVTVPSLICYLNFNGTTIITIQTHNLWVQYERVKGFDINVIIHSVTTCFYCGTKNLPMNRVVFSLFCQIMNKKGWSTTNCRGGGLHERASAVTAEI